VDALHVGDQVKARWGASLLVQNAGDRRRFRFYQGEVVAARCGGYIARVRYDDDGEVEEVYTWFAERVAGVRGPRKPEDKDEKTVTANTIKRIQETVGDRVAQVAVGTGLVVRFPAHRHVHFVSGGFLRDRVDSEVVPPQPLLLCEVAPAAGSGGGSQLPAQPAQQTETAQPAQQQMEMGQHAQQMEAAQPAQPTETGHKRKYEGKQRMREEDGRGVYW